MSAAMGASIRDTDKGYARTLKQFGALSGGRSVLVGVQGREAKEQHEVEEGEAKEQHEVEEGEAPITVGEIASQHELGLGVPERSWLRAWCDQNDAKIKEDLRAGMRQILRGRLTADQVVQILGVKYVGQIQAFISDNQVQPPTSAATNKRKGSSTTLVDTGQLKSAITWVVEQAIQGARRGGSEQPAAKGRKRPAARRPSKAVRQFGKGIKRATKTGRKFGKAVVRKFERTRKKVLRAARRALKKR